MSEPRFPDQTKTDGRKRIDPSPNSENRKGGVPNLAAALEAAAFAALRDDAARYGALADSLEADAETVETYERMDPDRSDLPGLWPSLFGEPEGGDR